MQHPAYTSLSLAISLSILFCGMSTPAQADSAGLFAKGGTQFAIYGGSGTAFNNDYSIIGVSAGYYIADGYSIGLSAEVWSGASPGIQKVSPSLTYVFYKTSVVKPYVGAFYRHTYVDNLPDLNSLGARAGIYIVASKNMYIGLGGVYESYTQCDKTTYGSCNDTYTEISLTFAF
jgi:hypothetical protein